MKHCLLVDDSDVVRKVARRILEDFNITSTEAENGQQALDMCRKAMPDVVLLDWHMPAMGAHEFLSLLRHTPGGDHPVVIYCTTENDPHDITKARLGGATEVLMKPFDQESLTRKLQQTRII